VRTEWWSKDPHHATIPAESCAVSACERIRRSFPASAPAHPTNVGSASDGEDPQHCRLRKTLRNRYGHWRPERRIVVHEMSMPPRLPYLPRRGPASSFLCGVASIRRTHAGTCGAEGRRDGKAAGDGVGDAGSLSVLGTANTRRRRHHRARPGSGSGLPRIGRCMRLRDWHGGRSVRSGSA
jgi:hypothetical protein